MRKLVGKLTVAGLIPQGDFLRLPYFFISKICFSFPFPFSSTKMLCTIILTLRNDRSPLLCNGLLAMVNFCIIGLKLCQVGKTGPISLSNFTCWHSPTTIPHLRKILSFVAMTQISHSLSLNIGAIQNLPL